MNLDREVKDEPMDEVVAENPMEKLDNQKKQRAREESRQFLGNPTEFTGYEAENLSSNLKVFSLEVNDKTCNHKMIFPREMAYYDLEWREGEPPKKYPFELDSFQKEAHRCIDNHRSVLVSAHTSAGKTVVATYAIAQCFQQKKRVIYTSPMKALSNQKYRELKEEFHDVGLLTGDVTINPDGQCLVMTTEILRSMLYRGSQVLEEVAWVIYDEVHYMRDKERGVVWEETIILLSLRIKQVFLSATVPNAIEFAQWVAHIKQQPVHVVWTISRPVPLQHFVYPIGAESFYQVLDVQGKFVEGEFIEAMKEMRKNEEAALRRRQVKKFDSKKKKRVVGAIVPVIRTIANNDALNCIVFSFSRRECEEHALDLVDMDFNTEIEKKMVKSLFDDALIQLPAEDKEMPQIKNILPMLQRGIAVHHSGLMPILKETIEILFAGDFIKVLFATETFSMGINMPAKSVVFTSARKFDGDKLRFITSGEYVQMAGRAGRRGKDAQGHVVLMIDAEMEPDVACGIITGEPDPLVSQFRLSYNMVLNLMRIEGLDVNWMIHSSFQQFQSAAKLPELDKKIIAASETVSEMVLPWENEMKEYVKLTKKLEDVKHKILEIQKRAQYLIGFLSPGRLIRIKANERDFKWGILHSFRRDSNPNDQSDSLIILDMIIAIDPSVNLDPYGSDTMRPGYDLKNRKWIRAPFTVDRLAGIANMRLKLPKQMLNDEEEVQVDNLMRFMMDRLNHDVPLLHPVKDMEIRTVEMERLVAQENDLQRSIENHAMRRRNNFADLEKKYERKMEAVRKLEALRNERKTLKSTGHLEELEIRKNVLRKLKYLNEDGSILLGGLVASELTVSDELVLTEMIMNNVFDTLDADQIVSLLSCFVFQDIGQSPHTSQAFTPLLESLFKEARHVAKVSSECRFDVSEEKYIGKFNPGLMEVVHQWMNGSSFADITQGTDIFEGTIIRCFRRLEEVLREMRNATKANYNKRLEQEIEKARELLKRDIVFANSLYL